MDEKFDVAIVGGGLAGLTCGYCAAQAGLKVAVVERGEYPGAKNVMGGVLYVQPFLDMFPDFLAQAPLERKIMREEYWFLDGDDAFTLSHHSQRWKDQPNAYTVMRAKFDQWYAQKVEDVGALLITETNVVDLLREGQQVVGLVTDRPDGEIRAEVVVLTDGANGTVASHADLFPRPDPTDMALAVKEVLELPREVIEQRFHTPDSSGAAIEMFGSFSDGALGMAFLYTNVDSVSLGCGGIVSQMAERAVNPNDWLNTIRRHPAVAPLIEGGRVKEYSAHLIPEGGYNAMPPLFGPGWMVAGDAAMMVIGLHREGSNFAVASGRAAAETAVKACAVGDYTLSQLAQYRTKLKQSFVLPDLAKYRAVTGYFAQHPDFLTVYPRVVNEFAHQIMTVDGTSKWEKQRAVSREFRRYRTKWQAVRELAGLLRTLR